MGTLVAKAQAAFTQASSIANDGTVTLAYPTGFVQAGLTGSTGGMLVKSTGEKWPQVSATGGVTFTFGSSDITLTNKSGAAIPAGDYFVSYAAIDIDGSFNPTYPRD